MMGDTDSAESDPITAPALQRWRSSVAVSCALALVLAGCGAGATDGTSQPATGGEVTAPPLILATTTIWADVVQNVACGGLAEVDSVMPPGADPHQYEPSFADRARLDEADLIVANGLGLEVALADTLDSAEADGTPVFTIGEHMTTLAFDAETFGGQRDTEAGDHDEDHAEEDDDHDEDDEDHDEDDDHEDDDHEDDDHEDHDHEDHDHGDVDPHVWLDPVRVAGAVQHLAGSLVEQTGLDAGRVADCTDAYLAELADVHEEIIDAVATIPVARRKLVTNHDSLGYFADRYGFEVVGSVIPATTTLGQASPASLEELARLIEEIGVPAIFAEDLGHSAGEANALANRLDGVTVESLYAGALGAEGSGADSYGGMMRHNAAVIAAALAGS